MRIPFRHVLGTAIGLVLVVLALGVAMVISVIPDAEPFGYGASGIGVVAGAGAMGGLAVLLLILLIAWRRSEGPRKMELLIRSRWLSSRKYWVAMLICGWLGTFWTIIGIARVWHWIDICLGAMILTVACIVAWHFAQEQNPDH